jgi:hypothetical protein
VQEELQAFGDILPVKPFDLLTGEEWTPSGSESVVLTEEALPTRKGDLRG